MSNHGELDSAHPAAPAKTFVWVWICLIVLTGDGSLYGIHRP